MGLLKSSAERSKATVCGRSLAGVANSNPAGAWMFLLCIVSKNKKANYRTVKTKKQLRMKEKGSEENKIKIPEGDEIFCTRPDWS
jgi:hypothetical protein